MCGKVIMCWCNVQFACRVVNYDWLVWVAQALVHITVFFLHDILAEVLRGK